MALCQLCEVAPSRTTRCGISMCNDCADGVDSHVLPEFDHDPIEQYAREDANAE